MKKAKKRRARRGPPKKLRGALPRREPNEGEALGALLDRIQRKGERRLKEALARTLGPSVEEGARGIQHGLSGAFEGLMQLDKMLGDDEEDEDAEEEE